MPTPDPSRDMSAAAFVAGSALQRAHQASLIADQAANVALHEHRAADEAHQRLGEVAAVAQQREQTFRQQATELTHQAQQAVERARAQTALAEQAAQHSQQEAQGHVQQVRQEAEGHVHLLRQEAVGHAYRTGVNKGPGFWFAVFLSLLSALAQKKRKSVLPLLMSGSTPQPGWLSGKGATPKATTNALNAEAANVPHFFIGEEEAGPKQIPISREQW